MAAKRATIIVENEDGTVVSWQLEHFIESPAFSTTTKTDDDPFAPKLIELGVTMTATMGNTADGVTVARLVHHDNLQAFLESGVIQ